MLGGSGSLNGMAYYRGNARDFDDWAAAGNPGWSYADLLPYFLRSEDNPDYAGSPWHNVGGPMRVSFMPRPNRLNEAFKAAMADLQFPHCDDFNVPEPEGYGYRQGTIGRGRRVSTASAYLRPAIKRRNLTVLTGTPTRRIILSEGRATGVEIEGRLLTANREVILSAGAFHSPHILMQSGIGDGAILSAKGITPLHQLAGVGQNLQDHPAASVAMDMDDLTSYGLSWRTAPRALWNGIEFLAARTGPLASNLFETTAYIKTLPGLDRPDMQLVFQPARRNPKPFPLPLGHGYAISVVCIYPKSKGSVTPAGPDPLGAPLIDPALGADEQDMAVLVRGLRLARRVIGCASFTPYGAHERLPGPATDSDEALADYIRETLATVHHPGGTCRMGQDASAVVDSHLRVHGIAGLRVADASIYPRLVGGNTNASVVAIAEKAADMILGLAAPAPLHHLRHQT
jgi:choline dehydrogenase-like flavoprotein